MPGKGRNMKIFNLFFPLLPEGEENETFTHVIDLLSGFFPLAPFVLGSLFFFFFGNVFAALP